MSAHREVEGQQQRELAKDGCEGRRHIAEAGNQQQVGNDIDGHAKDKCARQVVLLVDGDQHVLRHAVHKADGDAPDDDTKREVGAAHVFPCAPKGGHGAGDVEILLAAHNRNQRARQEGHAHGNRQRHHEQHAQAEHVRTQQVVSLLARQAAHERKKRHCEHAGDDVEAVEILEPHAVQPHAYRPGQWAQNPDVNAPEDGGQQVVDHQRAADAQHGALQLAIPRPLWLEERAAHEQPEPEHLEHVDDEAYQSQPDKTPAQQQHQRAEGDFEQRHGVGQPGGVLHFFKGVEHAAEGVGIVGEEHGKGQQRDCLHLLRADGLDLHQAAAEEVVAQHVDLDAADVAVEERHQREDGHHRRPEEGAHGKHIGQVSAGAVLVLGHVARQQRAQPVAAHNFEEAVERDDKIPFARALRPQQAHIEHGKGKVNRLVGQAQPHGHKRILGNDAHFALVLVGVVVAPPEPEEAEEEQRHHRQE